MSALLEALAVYDAAAVDCPARKRHLGDAKCPACRSGPGDGCGKEIGAAFALVDHVRAIAKARGQ